MGERAHSRADVKLIPEPKGITMLMPSLILRYELKVSVVLGTGLPYFKPDHMTTEMASR